MADALQRIENTLEELASQLAVVETEQLPIASLAGRILAEPLIADRDSPPCDVSAMDGYAFLSGDLLGQEVPVAATIAAGSPPVLYPADKTVRIFTGAAVPDGTYGIVPRERLIEKDDRVILPVDPSLIALGSHIRRKGENGRKGETVLPSGTLLGPSEMAGIATFAAASMRVHRPLRVAIVQTGDELISPGTPALPWQARESNGIVLHSMLKRHEWLSPSAPLLLRDHPEAMETTLRSTLENVDAVLITGGVSKGDCDYVPEVVAKLANIHFHGLPIRPGKPILGATTADGKLILGLPGNPVSVAVTARRLAYPWLRVMAGMGEWKERTLEQVVVDAIQEPLPLVWFRLVQTTGDGRLTFQSSRGSGDIVSLSHSDGFVQVPEGATGLGPWLYFRW